MTKRDRSTAARDENSIGNILLRITRLTDRQLDRALRYKDDHDDILLGEACVRLGFVGRARLEAAIAIQDATAEGGASSLLQLAIDRTRSATSNHAVQVALGVAVVDKLTS